MLGKRIRDAREAKRLTREELSQMAGVTQSSIYSYETGKRTPGADIIFSLARALDVTADYIVGLSKDMQSPGAFSVVESKGTVNVLGKVSAGNGISIREDILYKMPRLRDESFDLVVQGNSMYPEVADGDLVLIRQQPTPDYDGQTCLIRINNDDAVLKRFHQKPNGVTLKPANPEFEEIFIDRYRWATDCEFIGVVVGTVRLSRRDCP